MTTKAKAKVKVPATKLPAKNDFRSKLIAKGKSKTTSKLMPLMGSKVEVRVLSFRALFNMQQEATTETDIVDGTATVSSEKEDKINGAKQGIRMFISCVYEPNTNNRLFRDSDLDEILSWPFNQEIINIIEVINDMSNFDSKEAEKKSS